VSQIENKKVDEPKIHQSTYTLKKNIKQTKMFKKERITYFKIKYSQMARILIAWMHPAEVVRKKIARI